MEKIRDLQMTFGKYAKIKVADIQRLYSKCLWLVMAVYKPSFADAEMKCKSLIICLLYCWVRLWPALL